MGPDRPAARRSAFRRKNASWTIRPRVKQTAGPRPDRTTNLPRECVTGASVLVAEAGSRSADVDRHAQTGRPPDRKPATEVSWSARCHPPIPWRRWLHVQRPATPQQGRAVRDPLWGASSARAVASTAERRPADARCDDASSRGVSVHCGTRGAGVPGPRTVSRVRLAGDARARHRLSADPQRP